MKFIKDLRNVIEDFEKDDSDTASDNNSPTIQDENTIEGIINIENL